MSSRILTSTLGAIKAGAGGVPAASLSAVAAGRSFKLPELPYEPAALEPYISRDIMTIHHTKHHQAYVNNLNAALEQYAEASAAGDLQKMINLQGAIRFNGGGHVNHSIFWTNLAPAGAGGGGEPSGTLASMIKSQYGGFDAFQKAMSAAAAGVQGSGWAWLGYHAPTSRLQIATCANQDPCILTGLTPLLGIDVWEHAYYLQYKNVRADYLGALWNVINWGNVESRLDAVKK